MVPSLNKNNKSFYENTESLLDALNLFSINVEIKNKEKRQAEDKENERLELTNYELLQVMRKLGKVEIYKPFSLKRKIDFMKRSRLLKYKPGGKCFLI